MSLAQRCLALSLSWTEPIEALLQKLLQTSGHDLSSYGSTISKSNLVIREARKGGDLLYNGHKIRLYDDYSPDLLKQRAEFKTCMAELYQRGYKPALLYPAKLRVTLPNGERAWLPTVAEATKFVHGFVGG